MAVKGEGIVPVEQHGTALMTPLPHGILSLTLSCPSECAGRLMKQNVLRTELKTVALLVSNNNKLWKI